MFAAEFGLLASDNFVSCLEQARPPSRRMLRGFEAREDGDETTGALGIPQDIPSPRPARLAKDTSRK